jgi:hypothetical protein
MSRKSDRLTVRPSLDPRPLTKDSDARVTMARPRAPEPMEDVSPDPHSEVRLLTHRHTGSARPPSLARPEAGDGAWAGTMSDVPVVVMSVDRLKRLPLDHRAGFLLSLMDGAIDVETLLEIAGMPRVEVLRLVQDLFDSGVLDFRSPG